MTYKRKMRPDIYVYIIIALADVAFAATVGESSTCRKRHWQCNDGSCIRSVLKCDGQADCGDGSDETSATCANKLCPVSTFQCDYGACIDEEKLCDGEPDCVDESDEHRRTCNKSNAEEETDLYNYKTKNGKFSAIKVDFVDDFLLSLSCDPGYAPNGLLPAVLCTGGVCPKPLPQCVRKCAFSKQPNLRYYCPDPWIIDDIYECHDEVLTGTTVTPECIDPSYFSPHDIKCLDGEWDRNPICKPECGKVTHEPSKLNPTGDRALYSVAPWHATVYSKLTHLPVCGGTIISSTVVVSAAHCFWDGAVGLLPPTYRVVVGTAHRDPFSGPDIHRQQQDVNDITLPGQFHGTPNTLKYDIALVKVAAPFQWSAFVTAACLDFDAGFNQRQISGDTLGRFPSWDETTGVLKALDLSILPVAACSATYSTRQWHITNDQICAGPLNGTITPGKTTAGAGLVVANTHHGVERFYLRGVASAPSVVGQPIVFTQIVKHQKFISG